VSAVPAAELASHPFLRGLPDGQVARLAEVATSVDVPACYRFFEEGGHARRFWLIRDGHVALDLAVPGRPPLIVETLGAGDLMGVSWLSPPHEWQYGAEALEPTSTFQLDGAAVITRCGSDPALGYQFFARLMTVATRRLHSSRIRMLDLYAAPDQTGAR
jgi:CRP/FNR family transcriptional regulator, cyclic AMP receptor protein